MADRNTFSKTVNGDFLSEGFFNETSGRITQLALMGALGTLRKDNDAAGNPENLLYQTSLSQVGSSSSTLWDYTNTTGCLGTAHGYAGVIFDDFTDAASITGTLWNQVTVSGAPTFTVTTTDKGYVTVAASASGSNTTTGRLRSNGASGLNLESLSGNSELFIAGTYALHAPGSNQTCSVSLYLSDGTNRTLFFSASVTNADTNGSYEVLVNFDKAGNTAYYATIYNGTTMTKVPVFSNFSTGAWSGTTVNVEIEASVVSIGAGTGTATHNVYVVGYNDLSVGNLDFVTTNRALNNASDTSVTYLDRLGSTTVTKYVSGDNGGSYTTATNNTVISQAADSSNMKLKFTVAKPTTITVGTVNGSLLRGYAVLYD